MFRGDDDEPDSDGFDGYLDELQDRSSDDDSDVQRKKPSLLKDMMRSTL